MAAAAVWMRRAGCCLAGHQRRTTTTTGLLLRRSKVTARALSSDTSSGRKADLVIYDKDGTLIDFDAAWTPWVKNLAQKPALFGRVAPRTRPCHQQRRGFLTTSKPLPEKADYIVLGAGTAGCVLANRLSEDSDASVLVVEAGGSDHTWKIQMPAALMYTLFSPKYNWCYNTEPQQHMNGRVMYWPRGKVLGGCSSHNAMVYVRGHAYDYDRWSEEEGATGWSYAECLPYFQKSQTHELGAGDYRGGDGPQYVSRGIMLDKNPLHNAYVEAMLQAGYPFTEDMNGYQQEGVGYMDMTIKQGKRHNTSAAFLDPVRSRTNLQISTKTRVKELLIENGRCVGVELIKGGTSKKVYAEREVILSAGAINSPQILMLSGVGDADQLKEHGVESKHHLPGIGKNLQDHLEVYYQHKCTQPITLYKYQWRFPHHMIMTGIQWFLTHSGAGATTHLEAGGFIRSAPEVSHPDIQFHFLPSVVINHGSGLGNCHAFQVHVGPMRSKSRGYVKLRSRNPDDPPVMNPNYLSHEDDVTEFRRCVRLTKEIFDQPAFDAFKGALIQPKVDLNDDNQIDAFVRSAADSSYHPSCTCKMGRPTDPDAVVDPECRVIGLDGLRIVDASAFPSIVSGNLNGPVIMMAEKAADIIQGKQPLPKSNAPVYKPKTAAVKG